MTNQLEYSINKLIEYLIKTKEGFGWKNSPERTFSGTYKTGEVFDYIIFTANKVYCFDCKETKNKTWNIKDKDIKQAIHLKKVSKFNTDSFFLISFNKSLIKLDIDIFFDILTKRKNIKPSDGIMFDFNLFI